MLCTNVTVHDSMPNSLINRLSMEDGRKKHPSLPSNYVTLVQLQERWHEEQKRKQREKVEEEERKRREKEEEGRKLDDRENREREYGNSSSRGRPSWFNRRNRSAKVVGESDRHLEGAKIAVIVVDGGETKIEDLKKKKWKPRGEGNLIEGTGRVLPEKRAAAEKIPVSSKEVENGNSSSRGRPSRFNHRNRSAKAVGASDLHLERAQIAAIVVDDGETKIEDSKKNWKPRGEGNLIEGTERVLPEKIAAAEKIPVSSKEVEKGNSSSRSRPSRFNHRNRSEQVVGASDRHSEGAKIAAIVVDGGETKIEGWKKKKKKRKPRGEGNLIEGTERVLPEKIAVAEKIPVSSKEEDGEEGGVSRECYRNGKNCVVKARVLEEKVAVVKIGRKFEGMKMSGGRGGNERDVKNVHSGQWKCSRGSEGFNGRRMQQQRDSSLVWVRKGDTSDGDVA
ncbi:hypothetical protein CEY00_Acc23817 [Actinidia chinensis var. chinensis]|uniref:Uncharacterized protein n=1 Tax=Actinidia chinensis var. chinensis TaxID=1590841 RepID=A0A2R6Q0J2_ACTCC|nr:hypothetical protein CEY00_Acc23817 [Actinidia chinensis var. chinensis]